MSEESLIVGPEQNIVATLTTASGGAIRPPPCIALLTNSGVIPRIGPHRINVHLARRFADMGIPSIRFDMSGLGDSGRSGGTLPIAEQWVADTRSAMDAAQARFGSAPFFMVGLCSGALVAHLVAAEDRRLRAAVLWDLYAYPTLQSRLRTLLYRLQRAGLRKAALKAMGKAVSAIAGLGRSAAEAGPGGNAAEGWTIPPRDEFAGRIQSLVDQDVEIMFAFCGGEPEWFNHTGQFRAMFRGHEFVDKVAFTYLEDSDHLITRREAQRQFIDMVVDWLNRRVLPAA